MLGAVQLKCTLLLEGGEDSVEHSGVVLWWEVGEVGGKGHRSALQDTTQQAAWQVLQHLQTWLLLEFENRNSKLA